MRRRVIPKTLKNASQKLLASASSDFALSHSLENSTARARISFQLNGMSREPTRDTHCVDFRQHGTRLLRSYSPLYAPSRPIARGRARRRRRTPAAEVLRAERGRRRRPVTCISLALSQLGQGARPREGMAPRRAASGSTGRPARNPEQSAFACSGSPARVLVNRECPRLDSSKLSPPETTPPSAPP